MADGRRKKVLRIGKDDLRRSVEDIRKELYKAEDSGRSSAKSIQRAFEGMGKKASTALNEAFSGNNFKGLKDIEESLKIQRKAVNDLTEQYKKAKAEFDSVNLGTQDEKLIAKREKASALYRQVKSELEGETNLLNKQEEAFKLISTELQTAGDKSVTFYTQMRQIREEMNALTLAGQDQTPQYDKLRSKLDEVSTAYRKVQQEQQMLAKYGNMLIPGLIQGISGLAGAFSVYQGVASMFAKDNESLAEIQTKLQRAMAITIGLQQVQQTLHSTSEFRIGVVRKATQAWTTAQTALNTSLGISKGLAGAFMTGGIMALVAGVGYLITKYRDWSKAQDKLRDTVKSYTDALSNEKAQLDYLFDTYKKAEEGTKAYKDAKKEIIDQLDKYYGGLNSEKLLVEDTTEAYRKLAIAIQDSAKEKALQGKYESLAKKTIEAQGDAYTDLYDKIVDKIGENKGAKLFTRIRKEIEEQGRLSAGLVSEINSEDSFYRRDFKSDRKTGASWMEKTDINEVYELAQTTIKKTKEAQEEYNTETEKARKILASFGTERAKVDGFSKSIIDSLREEREELLKLPEATEQEIAAKNRKIQVIDEEIKRLESLGKVEERRTTGSSGNSTVSLIEDIEKKRLEIAKQGIDDRLELLNIEEEYELDSLNKRLENAKYSEEEKQELILLVKKLYGLRRQQIITEEQLKQQADIDKSLEAYTSYEEQRNQIVEKYAKLRENAKGKKNIDTSLIDDKEQEELNKIDEFLVSRQDQFIQWSEGIIGLSLQQLRIALVEAQKELERIEFVHGKNSKEAGIVRQKVVKLETTINDTESSPNSKTLKQWQRLDRVLNDTSRSFKEMEGAIGGTIGEIVSSAGELATATVGMISSISSLAKNSVTAVQGTATAAATAISTAEKASVILAAIAAGMQIVATITKMFRKQNKEEKDTARLQAATTRISNTNAVINKLIEKRIDLINKATAAEMKYNETLTQAAINTQKGFIENEFRRLGGNDFFGKKGRNNNLKLKDLGITNMDKLAEFWDSEERLKLLQGGYDQRNKDEWQQIIDAYRALIDAEEQLAVAKKESLTGMSLEDAQNGLDDFIKDAEKGFNDVAKSFEDTMSNAMLNLIKKQYMNEALEAWYGDFAKAMEDDSLSDAEVEALRDQYYAIYEEGKKRLDSMKEVIGEDSSMNQQSSVGVTKTASQDSIDVLNGRLTHVQETNQEISNNSTAMLEQMKSSFTSLNEQMSTANRISLSNMYQIADIVKNTNVLPGMAKDMAEVRRNTNGLVR